MALPSMHHPDVPGSHVDPVTNRHAAALAARGWQETPPETDDLPVLPAAKPTTPSPEQSTPPPTARPPRTPSTTTRTTPAPTVED